MSEKERPAEQRKRKLKAKERQATLLLGIILSAFILSWLPFFVSDSSHLYFEVVTTESEMGRKP